MWVYVRKSMKMNRCVRVSVYAAWYERAEQMNGAMVYGRVNVKHWEKQQKATAAAACIPVFTLVMSSWSHLMLGGVILQCEAQILTWYDNN